MTLSNVVVCSVVFFIVKQILRNGISSEGNLLGTVGVKMSAVLSLSDILSSLYIHINFDKEEVS